MNVSCQLLKNFSGQGCFLLYTIFMTIQIGHLYKKRTVRNLNGGIKYMEDEANGGVLIRNGQVINQQRIDEIARIEEDKRNSATAFANPVEAPKSVSVEERNVAPSKVEKLEKEVGDMKENIATILKLLQK